MRPVAVLLVLLLGVASNSNNAVHASTKLAAPASDTDVEHSCAPANRVLIYLTKVANRMIASEASRQEFPLFGIPDNHIDPLRFNDKVSARETERASRSAAAHAPHFVACLLCEQPPSHISSLITMRAFLLPCLWVHQVTAQTKGEVCLDPKCITIAGKELCSPKMCADGTALAGVQEVKGLSKARIAKAECLHWEEQKYVAHLFVSLMLVSAFLCICPARSRTHIRGRLCPCNSGLCSRTCGLAEAHKRLAFRLPLTVVFPLFCALRVRVCSRTCLWPCRAHAGSLSTSL